MHMADALVSPAVAGVMYAATGVVAGLSVNSVRKDGQAEKLPTMAVMSAMVFAGQMINYTIPGTGSSGHMCGGMLLTSLLGPQAGFLSMIVILAIQCLFFADGGLLALGANIWNMAFYGCFVGYYLLYRPIMSSPAFSKLGERTSTRIKIILSSILGAVLTLQLGSFSVVLQTTASGITELPFSAFLTIMQPIHLIIGLIEGLITSAVLLFVYEIRPELLPLAKVDGEKIKNRASFKSTIAVLAAVVVAVGGGLSLVASENPDGLEWSMFGNKDSGYSENLRLNEENYGVKSQAADKAGQIVDKTAVLPDYSFKNSDSSAGTTVSGLVGSVAVAGCAILICGSISLLKKKKQSKEQ